MKKQVIPLDIELNSGQRILIISGPNAGGKSVCLKTVGLLQYMYQCGLLPPVKEDSEFRVFENIFIDIGDEQSIDNDLSTYTSKLYNLKYFIEHSNENTLFLIDELGTGTDPSLGGAIAEATLEALNARKACGVVTTHYSNLKLLASREEGIANGAMLFDLKKLKPLYKLSAGKPGSSFALEIAREIGFPEEVLEAAKQKTGKSQLDFDRELQNLEVEKGEIEKKSTELRVADDFLDELITKYQKLTAELEKSKKDILSKAKQEAKEILDGSNKLIEKTIKEIREAQAEKEKTKEVRAILVEEKQRLMQDAGSKIQDAGGKMQEAGGKMQDAGSKIQDAGGKMQDAGSKIQDAGGKMQDAGSKMQDAGSKIQDAGSKIQDAGSKMQDDLEALHRHIGTSAHRHISTSAHQHIGTSTHQHIGTSAHQHISTSRSAFSGYLADLQAKHDGFRLTLDLRGKRVDEALSLLQRYIDDAILLSMGEVRILHGKGNGVLRQVTRDYLRSQKEVKSATDEKLEAGGTGITVVSLR